MISNGEHKSKSISVDLSLGYCNEQKQAIRIHMQGQRLEGESGISGKVCHQHGPLAGLAHNQQFTLKVFATALTNPQSSLALWLNLFSPTSTPFFLPLPCCPVSQRASEAFYYSPDYTLTSLSLSLSSLSLPLSFTHCLFHLKTLKTFHRRSEWLLFSDYCKHAREAKQIYI